MFIKYQRCQSKKQGFTLIELLVVVAIIAILVTIVTLLYSEAKARARDSQRMTEIRGIQNALAVYWDSRYYYPSNFVAPPGTAINNSTDPLSVVLKNANVTQALPVDPRSGQQDTGVLYNYDYYYRSIDAQGNGYDLTYCLETDSAAGQMGCHTISE